jgi:hypothetical protein
MIRISFKFDFIVIDAKLAAYNPTGVILYGNGVVFSGRTISDWNKKGIPKHPATLNLR